MIGSPSANSAEKFVYSISADAEPDNVDSGEYKEVLSDVVNDADKKGESMYVTLFEEMLDVALSAEAYLFNSEELRCFSNYAKLKYEARYLFIRLCLRKADQWIRLGDLKYQAHLGDKILPALRALCSSTMSFMKGEENEDVKVKMEEPDDIIDLTAGEDVKPLISELMHSSSADRKPFFGSVAQPDYSTLAEDESHAQLRELLECLRVDELREVVKRMNVPKKENTRDGLINTLLSRTVGQTTLAAYIMSPAKPKTAAKNMVQSALTSFMSQKGGRTQQDRLRAVVLEKLGACIKLSPNVVKLFKRVNIVYFRSTQYTPSMLTQAILARCRKRNFTPVAYCRSASVWESRQALVHYEAALELEGQIDEIWGSGTGTSSTTRARSRSALTKTPAPTARETRSITQSPSKRQRGQEGNTADEQQQNTSLEHDGDSLHIDGSAYGDSSQDPPRVRDARAVRAVFERAYSMWKELVAVKGDIEPRMKGLERFHHGHVLTRIVCKGAQALGILKEYDAELTVLEELLRQRRWRRGRRGRWHERRALILTTHFAKCETTYEKARQAVIEGLRDSDTHIIYRPKLVRRILSLEKKLALPNDDRLSSAGVLTKAPAVDIKGVRLRTFVDATGKLATRTSGQTKRPKEVEDEDKQTKLPFTQTQAPLIVDAKTPLTGKSIWQGRDGAEVNVETYALQHYETLGYKGFHCEGRIVTTIFGLLFWDVIFASIPGAFETLYQVAPLDIAEDSFYTSREDLFRARADAIRDGKAAEILAENYDKYSPAKTECVGVRWELFEKEDLLGIVQCLGCAGLAAICQVMAEDYVNRAAGVPDLIIWNAEQLDCKFVEVKGPGDSLQENQKVWIDVLLQANVPVEVCHVAEEGQPSPKKSRGRKKATTTSKKRKRESSEAAVPEVVHDSELEEEFDSSQLDPTPREKGIAEDEQPQSQPQTPKKFKKLEVLMTKPSPRKRPRLSPQT